MSSLESIIAGSPALALAVAVLAGLFVFLVLGAVVSNWRDRRRHAAVGAAPAPPHPYAAAGSLPDDQSDPGARAPSAVAPVPRRRGFGLAALSIAFVLGLAAGVAAMAVARDDLAGGLVRLAGLVGAGDVAPAPGAARGDEPGPSARPEVATPGPEVLTRLADFAAGLEQTLPRPAGPELSLTRVSVEGATLNLGYGVARVVPPGEVDDFRAYVDRTVRSLFCAREAREVRYLSENGVDFHMTYVDPSGLTVTELTVTPKFCA